MTKEEKVLELLKCKNDLIYFINHYVYIEEPGGLVPFKTYPKQEEFARSYLEDHYVIVLKSRQIGISTISRAICAWNLLFYDNVTIGVLSRDGSESTDFARKTRNIIESLPKWMQPEFEKRTEQSFILKNGSALFAATVNQSNPSSVFRGKTLTTLVLDEAAFTRNIEEAYTGIAPAVLKAHQVAKEKKIPYGILIISTPKGVKDPVGYWYHDRWVEAEKGESGFKPIRIHYSDAPFANEEWLKEMKKIITDPIQWQQEMELKFVTSNNSLFKAETALKMQSSKPLPPLKTEEKVYFNRYGEKVGEGTWNWFKHIETHRYYIAGVDVAAGYIGSCNSAIQIIDAETLEQVAEFEGKLRVGDLKDELVSLVDKFYDNLLLVPEMNSIGIRLVEELEDDDRVYNSLYYTTVKNNKGKVVKRIPGIETTGKTRPRMVDALFWTVTEDPSRLRSQNLISQLLSLDRNLRGGLSDISIAYAIAVYVARNEKEMIRDKISAIKDYRDQKFYDSIFIEGNNFDKADDDKIFIRGF